jgi:hypothetical protein
MRVPCPVVAGKLDILVALYLELVEFETNFDSKDQGDVDIADRRRHRDTSRRTLFSIDSNG